MRWEGMGKWEDMLDCPSIPVSAELGNIQSVRKGTTLEGRPLYSNVEQALRIAAINFSPFPHADAPSIGRATSAQVFRRTLDQS